ncbi:basic proline-rich protein-like [Pipistrellus kuhlii]|uniref:basic proline-rich protein-like n=1 Tax=Pipistrellus kuhlii TaxID=59472 RepID=UPI00174F1B44|nr:basic proline-rich protein-like [Pipistrellus kuhlii]
MPPPPPRPPPAPLALQPPPPPPVPPRGARLHPPQDCAGVGGRAGIQPAPTTARGVSPPVPRCPASTPGLQPARPGSPAPANPADAGPRSADDGFATAPARAHSPLPPPTAPPRPCPRPRECPPAPARPAGPPRTGLSRRFPAEALSLRGGATPPTRRVPSRGGPLPFHTGPGRGGAKRLSVSVLPEKLID